MARKPCLEDYDRNGHLVFWAEDIASHAHPCYDEYGVSEYAPPPRSRREVQADASAAEARYKAHREQARLAEIEARKHREASRAEMERRQRAQRAEAAERQLVREEAERQRWAAREEIYARQQQWEREQQEWREQERREAAARATARYLALREGAKSVDALGRGHIIRIANKNVNIGQGIRLEVGEIWDVGQHWFVTLINDGYAVAL